MKKYYSCLLLALLVSCVSNDKKQIKESTSAIAKDSLKSAKKSVPKIAKDTVTPAKKPSSAFRLTYEKKKDRTGSFYEIEEIRFPYKGKDQVIKYVMYISDSLELENPRIYFADFNFDGYKDVMIYKHESGIHNTMFDRYLYDPEKESFYIHGLLSTLINCEIDSVNKTLTSTVYPGRGAISSKKTYEWKQDSLVVLHQE